MTSKSNHQWNRNMLETGGFNIYPTQKYLAIYSHRYDWPITRTSLVYIDREWMGRVSIVRDQSTETWDTVLQSPLMR